jgi:hypothetical protein
MVQDMGDRRMRHLLPKPFSMASSRAGILNIKTLLIFSAVFAQQHPEAAREPATTGQGTGSPIETGRVSCRAKSRRTCFSRGRGKAMAARRCQASWLNQAVTVEIA